MREKALKRNREIDLTGCGDVEKKYGAMLV
jgi:hypothetical protein